MIYYDLLFFSMFFLMICDALDNHLADPTKDVNTAVVMPESSEATRMQQYNLGGPPWNQDVWQGWLYMYMYILLYIYICKCTPSSFR